MDEFQRDFPDFRNRLVDKKSYAFNSAVSEQFSSFVISAVNINLGIKYDNSVQFMNFRDQLL